MPVGCPRRTESSKGVLVELKRDVPMPTSHFAGIREPWDASEI